MARSNKSNLQGLELFWSNASSENHPDWEKWAKKFQQSIIAKDVVGVKDVINLPFKSELTFPNLETSENIRRHNPSGRKRRKK